jgi:hypothetical protein
MSGSARSARHHSLARTPSPTPPHPPGVITWKECLNNNAAWDTLTWFAALIAMAAYLNKARPRLGGGWVGLRCGRE